VDTQGLVAALDLDVYELGICHACLSFVSMPLDAGNERETARALREFAPILWEEGLALPLQAALERACRRGVPGAEAAIADVQRRGARAAVVAPVVLKLAADLTQRTRADLERLGLLRPGSVLDFGERS
jgi:hypothetical protein